MAADTLTLASPRVFLSYSWTSDEHVQWVIELAERLRADGVDVVLDQWDLREGQDKFAFMERMVTDPTIHRVLILSDSGYATKANARAGGVGTETQILTPEVYAKAAQEKFLPILCQRDAEGEACVPVFLNVRKYIDFSSPSEMEKNYEQLVRRLFGRPLHEKPPLGSPPSFLLDEPHPGRLSRAKLRLFQDAVARDRSHWKGLSRDFLEALEQDLRALAITESPRDRPIDDLVVDRIAASLPLRDDLVSFLDTLIRYKDIGSAVEDVTGFLERLLGSTYPEQGPIHEEWFDPNRFFAHEAFLSLVALMLRYRRVRELTEVLDGAYLSRGHGTGRPVRPFPVFAGYCRSLEERNRRLHQGRRTSIKADIMKERATLRELHFDSLIEADLALFVRSLVFQQGDERWHPDLIGYLGYSRSLPLFARAASRRDFESIKTLFHVTSKEDFTQKFHEAAERHRLKTWPSLFFAGVSLEEALSLEKLDSMP